MKIEVPFLAALVPIGTSLLARMAAQGVEQALFSTAIEYGLDGYKGGEEASTQRHVEPDFDCSEGDGLCHSKAESISSS